MTERAIRQSVAECALKFKGRKESNGGHREIIDLYNKIRPLPRGYRMRDTDPWCAAFVSAVAYLCGLLSIIFPECGCGPMVELYKKAKRWVEDDNYLPDVGDVVFYDWQDSGKGDNVGAPDHVGLVVAVAGKTITVIEGNKSDAVGLRALTRGARYVRGYGVPDYATVATGDIEIVPESGTSEEIPVVDESAQEEILVLDPCTVETYELVKGAVGDYVRAAQLLLIGRGFSCGPDGADGDFGPNTLGAVQRFQRARGLPDCGVVNAITWGALMGVL